MANYIDGIPIEWDDALNAKLFEPVWGSANEAAAMRQRYGSILAPMVHGSNYTSPFDSSSFADNTVADVYDEKKEVKIFEEEKSHLNTVVLCKSGTDVYKKYQADSALKDDEKSDLLTLYCEDESGSNLFGTMYLVHMGGKHRQYIEQLKNGDFAETGINGKSGMVIKKKIHDLDDKIEYLQMLVEERVAEGGGDNPGLVYRAPSKKEIEKALALEMMAKNDPAAWLNWYYGIDEWSAGKIEELAAWVKNFQFRDDQYNYVKEKKYEPILPIQFAENIAEDMTDTLRKNKGEMVAGIKKFKEKVQQLYRRLHDPVLQKGSPRCADRIFEKLQGFTISIIEALEKMAQRIDVLFKELTAAAVDGLRIINALLCGLIDGFLSLVEGLLLLLGYLVDNVVGWTLRMDMDELITAEGRMKSMNRLELFEDMYDTLTQNWHKAVAAVSRFFDGLTWENIKGLFSDVIGDTTRYQVAHFAGSCIFEIIVGVILAIVTGGGSAIAQAATKSAKFVRIIRLVLQETVSSVTMGLYDFALLLKAFFTRLLQAAAGGFGGLYQFFKRLINGFFEVEKVAEGAGASSHTFKTLAEDVFGLLKNVQKFEDEIRLLEHEAAKFFDAEGNEVSKLLSQQEKAEVSFTQWEVDAARKKAKNGELILTHNHPKGSSISYEDIHGFVNMELNEIRAVTKDGTVYSLRKIDVLPEKRVYNEKTADIRNYIMKKYASLVEDVNSSRSVEANNMLKQLYADELLKYLGKSVEYIKFK
jgi:hypothetical protein